MDITNRIWHLLHPTSNGHERPAETRTPHCFGKGVTIACPPCSLGCPPRELRLVLCGTRWIGQIENHFRYARGRGY